MLPRLDAGCGQLGPNLTQSRTPSHFAGGSGGRQRRSPTGGAANGIPRKTRVEPSALSVPRIVPASSFTVGAAADCDVGATADCDAGAAAPAGFDSCAGAVEPKNPNAATPSHRTRRPNRSAHFVMRKP